MVSVNNEPAGFMGRKELNELKSEICQGPDHGLRLFKVPYAHSGTRLETTPS